MEVREKSFPQIMALKEPVDRLYGELEATNRCENCVARPSARIQIETGCVLIVAFILALPGMISLKIGG